MPGLPGAVGRAAGRGGRPHCTPVPVVVDTPKAAAAPLSNIPLPAPSVRRCPVSLHRSGSRRLRRRSHSAVFLAHSAGQLLGTCTQGTSLSTRGSPGRPRIRSPRMLRRISEVPPSIELARDRRNILRGSPPPVSCADSGRTEVVVVDEHAVRAQQVDRGFVDALVHLGERELAHRALRPGDARLAVLRGADVREAQHLGLGPEPRDLSRATGSRAARSGRLAPEPHEVADRSGLALRDRAADRHALVHQRRHRDAPAVADVTDAVRCRARARRSCTPR